MLKRFLSYYKPHRKIFVLDMLASLAVALLGIIYPIFTRTMLNDYIPEKKYGLIIISGIILLCLYLVRMLLNFFIQYKGHVMGVKMQAEMRSQMFRHLERLPFGYFDGHETGKLMSRMTNDLMNISELAHHGPENVIISGIDYTASVAEYQRRGATVYERVLESLYSKRILEALELPGAIRVSPLHCHGTSDIDKFLRIAAELARDAAEGKIS